MLAAHVAIADGAPAAAQDVNAAPSRTRACSIGPALPCLIEVRVTPAQPLRAMRLALVGTSRGVQRLAADGSRPRAVLLVSALGFGSALDRIAVTRSTLRATRILSLPKELLVGVDPTGSRALYLTETSKPALWEGHISNGQIVHPRQLIPDVWMQAITW